MGTARKLLAGAALLAMGAAAVPAGAVSFNLINTGGAGMGTQARAGFDIAAAYWSSVLTDNVTVNLQIGFRPLAPNVLGSAGSTSGALLVQNAYSRMAADRTTSLDIQAVGSLKSLQPAPDFGPGILGLDAITSQYVYVDSFQKFGVDSTRKFLDNDRSANNVVLDVNTANLKALGVRFDDNGDDITNLVDGDITFSSNFGFDFDPTNGITDGGFDFIAVAIHEIGHVLGFVSGVDIYDLVARPRGQLLGPFERGDFGTSDIGEFRVMNTLDLFRYSTDGLDWSIGGETFLSYDGGGQFLGDSRLSTGRFNGDGQQASHFKDNLFNPRTNPLCSNIRTTPLGILDPTIGACELGNVTAQDIAAFDAIGWNANVDVLRNPGYRFSTADAFRAFSVAVPEPATWLQMILGFGFVGASIRGARKAKVQIVAA